MLPVGGGWFLQKFKPLCGSILQAETCKILSLAENQRWSRVWQYLMDKMTPGQEYGLVPSLSNNKTVFYDHPLKCVMNHKVIGCIKSSSNWLESLKFEYLVSFSQIGLWGISLAMLTFTEFLSSSDIWVSFIK